MCKGASCFKPRRTTGEPTPPIPLGKANTLNTNGFFPTVLPPKAMCTTLAVSQARIQPYLY